MSRSLYGVVIAAIILAPILSSTIVLSEEVSVYPEIYGKDIIRIGATFSLSGKYTLEGLQALCGVKAAVDWINENGGIEFQGRSHRVQLVYFDDESSADKARELYARLYRDLGVRLLIAPYGEELLEAVVESINPGDAIMAVYSPSPTDLFKEGAMVFQVSSPPELRFSTLIDLIKERGIGQPVIVFYEDSRYGADVLGGIEELASKAGISIAGEYPYTSPEDIASAVDSIRGPVGSTVVVGQSYEEIKNVVANLYKAGLATNLIVLDSPASLSTIYVDLGSGVAENIVVSVGWEKGAGYNKGLAVQYKTDWYGPDEEGWLSYYKSHCKTIKASSIAASASAAMLLIANGIYWAGNDEPSRIWERLGGLFTMTFYGPFKIDPRSGAQIAHENILVQWQKGERRIVYPESQANGELIYPANNWLRTGTAREETTTTGVPAPTGNTTIIIIIIILVIAVVALIAVRKRT